MRVLIIDDNKDIITTEGEIVIVLRGPDSFPAIKVIPEGTDLTAWHQYHDELLRE